MSNHRINCFQCRYFYVTWDMNHPKGCKYFEFKSKLLPSMVVWKSSGQACLKFEPKS